VKLLAKILLCISVVLLFTHQLIPHDHDEHTELATHDPFENNHDHFATHNVDHLFYNNGFQPITLKVFVHHLDCITPFLFETIFVTQYISCKRKYKNIRPPLIDYYYHFSLRAPPVSA